MKVNIQSINFNIDQKLSAFIQKRMNKLDLFYDKIIKSDVFLKVENTSEKENKIFFGLNLLNGLQNRVEPPMQKVNLSLSVMPLWKTVTMRLERIYCVCI